MEAPTMTMDVDGPPHPNNPSSVISEQGQTIIHILLDDGQLLDVDRRLIEKMSTTIGSMLADLAGSNSNSNDSAAAASEPVPVPDVDADTMKSIIEFCAHHVNDAPVDTDARQRQLPSSFKWPEWDAAFFQISRASVTELQPDWMQWLMRLTNASTHLEIKPLLKLTCRAIAERFSFVLKSDDHPDKDNAIIRIRAELGIENDFTPEEEEQLRAEIRKYIESL